MRLLPILIIGILVVALGGVVLLKPLSKLNLRQESEIELPLSAEISLSLEPQKTSIQIGEEILYTVLLDSHEFNTYVTELRFSFDPQVISVTSLEPGDYFRDPDTLFTSIDSEVGNVRYTLGSLKPGTGRGIVANIKIKALRAYDSLDAPLKFNKLDTSVGLETPNKSKVFSKEETSIFFEEKTITILP